MVFSGSKEVSLRPFRMSDKERLVELANNKNISINLRDGFPHPYNIDDAERFIKNCINQNPVLNFAIELDGLYVGNIGLVMGKDVYRKSAEIGYFLGEPYWNMGIMSEAVNLMVDFGFENLDIVRIHTGVFEYNMASQRVLEKCGFYKEAVFKRAVFKNRRIWDEVRYAKLKTE